MKLRDIVNRDLVNLRNCESEPIHIPGSIQPSGFLLFVKGDPYKVLFCSSNVTAYCGIAPETLLTQTLGEAFGQDIANNLRDHLDSADHAAGHPIGLKLGKDRYSCAIHSQQGGWLINAEPYPDGYLTPPDLYQQTRQFVSGLERSATLNELCQRVARETRKLTGYDRVMIYRFDPDYNGEVIAEAADSRLEPFLGLHYPHTDIPAQARQLYLTNLLRIIPDVHYEPVPILTLEREADTPVLDLSHAVLRSVSPIHIAYLKNMGVAATLTISLVHNHRLWGLIACHHYSPKNLPHYTRLSAQLQGHFLTSQIALRESAARFEASQDIAQNLEHVLVRAGQLQTGAISSLLNQSILELACASGMAMMFNGGYYHIGLVPAREAVESLTAQLRQKGKRGAWNTNTLSEELPDARDIGPEAAGVLYHALGSKEDFIIWFRRESRQVKLWAGDPSKALVRDEQGLSPRKSFEQWQETVSGKSLPWSEAELHAAATVAHTLQKHLNYILLQAEELRNLEQSEQLRQANRELESINWISMHDLQEPLRKIQVFASRLLDNAQSGAYGLAVHDASRVFANARRMQDLVTDLQAYAHLNQEALQPRPVDLRQIVEAISQEWDEELKEKDGQIEASGLPVLRAEPFLLRQLFVNLLRNAIKFAQPDRPLHIAVGHHPTPAVLPNAVPAHEDGYTLLTMQDNGIGFDQEHADVVFGLFRRLHSREEYEGTGMGLAICRKIMQLHGGYITARSAVGKGATFELWFPKA